MVQQGIDGLRLRTARENAGLTVRDAARAIGVSHGYISQLELEFKDPGVIKVVVGLANLYGVSVDYLVGLEGNVARHQPDEGLPMEYRVALQVQREVFRKLADPEARVAMFEYMLTQGGDWSGFLRRIDMELARELVNHEQPVERGVQDA